MRAILSLVVMSALSAPALAIAIDQIDTFQSGTVEGWSGGAAPTNIANGGPGGAGDRYLQITSTGGFGAGANLATFNFSQWSGNFLAAGIHRIEVDLRNTGANPVNIRLAFFGANFDRWSSLQSIDLPANSGWVHATFILHPSQFTRTLGSFTFDDTLGAVERMMLRHEPVPSANGTAIAAQLGIDNVAARWLAPSAMDIIFGTLLNGGVSNLGLSDDVSMSIRQFPFRSRQDPAVRIELSANAPTGNVSQLRLALETGTDASPPEQVSQRIELYSFLTNTWVLVDARPMTTADQTVLLSITSNPTQYVNQSTGEVLARLSYFEPGTLFTRSWGIRFDWMGWAVCR